MTANQMESFLIYTSFYEPIKWFTDEQLGRLFRAIFQYKLGEEPEVQDDIRVAFEFFKVQLDFDGEKYQEKVRKRKEAGRLGGLTRGGNQSEANATKSKQKQANEANATNAKQTKQMLSKRSKCQKCLHDNDNDNDNEKHNEFLYNISNSASRVVSSTEADDAIAQAKKNKSQDSEIAKDVQNYYNKQIADKGARLVACQTLTDRRKSAVLARIKEYGIEKVRATIDNAVASEFLNFGATNAPVNFDWIFRPNNFPKIMEGFYANKNNPDMGRVSIDNSTDKFGKWKNGWT